MSSKSIQSLSTNTQPILSLESARQRFQQRTADKSHVITIQESQTQQQNEITLMKQQIIDLKDLVAKLTEKLDLLEANCKIMSDVPFG